MNQFSEYRRQVYDIIGAAMDVHHELHRGLLEAVYQEAMILELTKRGIECEAEKGIKVYYKKQLLKKQYKMDLVAGDIIVELKSVKEIIPEHRAQLCNYLRLTHKPIGILLNFGGASLYGERWAFDADSDECYLLDKNMQRAPIYLPTEDGEYYEE